MIHCVNTTFDRNRYLPGIFTLLIITEVEVEASNDTCVPANTTADAKTIVDSKFDPKVIASILPYRTQDECIAINTAIASLNAGKPLTDPKYIPVENTKPYDDLIFALVSDSFTIFSKYLGHYLQIRDETYIIMVFIQVDDRVKFKQTYDSQHDRCFDDARRAQRHPFANALKVWAVGNRIDVSIYNDSNDCCDQGDWLASEKHKWNEESRTGLEGMLMKHTIPYAQTGIKCYGKSYDPVPNLIDDITAIIKNHDLVDLFTSLVRYIQNDNDYLARILHDHCEGHDNFTLWIVVLSTRRTPDAKKALDKAFQDAYKGVTLKDFILKCQSDDDVFKNILAALADPSYNPYAKPASPLSHPPQANDD